MYLIAIGWLYVALMMAVAESMHPNGGVFSAVLTFIFYGLLPTGLVMYVMGTPLRRKARLAQEREEWLAQQQQQQQQVAQTTEVPAAEAPNSVTPPQAPKSLD